MGQRGDETGAFLVAAQREDLLELVDDQQLDVALPEHHGQVRRMLGEFVDGHRQPAGEFLERMWSGHDNEGRPLRGRGDARAEQGRLARPGRPEDTHEPALAQLLADLPDEPLPPEEQRGVVGLERGKADIGARPVLDDNGFGQRPPATSERTLAE
ncbi:hypothetical protein GCM10018954_095990 [Kutzneria kofuensis]